jgi:hypothetical protein
MLRTVVANARNSTFSATIIALAIVVFAPLLVRAEGGSSSINAIICASSASITLDHPLSDTITQQGSIPVDGTVGQAAQVEVYIDDSLDHIVPLGTSQTTFTTTVNLSEGTHTLKVVAVDRCGILNADKSAIITYTPPQPGTPSDNAGSQTGNVTVLPPGTTVAEAAPGGNNGPDTIVLPEPFRSIVRWLNIDTTVKQTTGLTALIKSTGRIALMATGLSLLIFGALGIVAKLAALESFKGWSKTRRMVFLSVMVRVVGGFLFLLAFYL